MPTFTRAGVNNARPADYRMVLDQGKNELLKASVHGAVGALAGVCLVYNAAALVKRPSPHLAINALFYAFLAAVECSHVAHHWQARQS